MKQSIDPSKVDWGLNTAKRSADHMLYRVMAFDLMQQYRRRRKKLRNMRPLMASIYYSSTGLSHQTQPQLQIVLLREKENENQE